MFYQWFPVAAAAAKRTASEYLSAYWKINISFRKTSYLKLANEKEIFSAIFNVYISYQRKWSVLIDDWNSLTDVEIFPKDFWSTIFIVGIIKKNLST